MSTRRSGTSRGPAPKPSAKALSRSGRSCVGSTLTEISQTSRPTRSTSSRWMAHGGRERGADGGARREDEVDGDGAILQQLRAEAHRPAILVDDRHIRQVEREGGVRRPRLRRDRLRRDGRGRGDEPRGKPNGGGVSADGHDASASRPLSVHGQPVGDQPEPLLLQVGRCDVRAGGADSAVGRSRRGVRPVSKSPNVSIAVTRSCDRGRVGNLQPGSAPCRGRRAGQRHPPAAGGIAGERAISGAAGD